MNCRKARGLAVSCAAAMVLLALAAPASAGLFDCLFGPPPSPCGPQPVVVSRTTYMPRFAARPLYAAPACSTCAAPACSSCAAPACSSCAAPSCSTCMMPACSSCVPQAVQYMPQTCYRSVIQIVPVTTYRAAVGCNACTGGCQTSYRPVTTYVRRTQLVSGGSYPVTTYRPYLSCAPAACSSCPSWGAGLGGASCSSCSAGFGTMPAPVLSGGCSSCGGAPQATVSPGAMTVAPSLPPAATGVAPGGSATSGPNTTFREGSGAATRVQRPPATDQGPELQGTEPKLQPQPMRQSGLKRTPGAGPWIAPFGAPQQVDPNSRTTALPVRPAVHYLPAGWAPRPNAPPAQAAIDDGGWRPARD